MSKEYKLITVLVLAITSCSAPSTETSFSTKPKVSVQVTGVSSGEIKNELTFSANTLYLKRNVVTTPIPAYITKVFVKLGEAVTENQLLYVLETKERKALGSNAPIPDSTGFGVIKVKAPASGTISTLDKQQIGDYVLEGAQLCTIAESTALAFAVNVPYEFVEYTKAGMRCTLILPDNSRRQARFTTPLTTMNTLAQTQTILAKSDERLVLPENLIISVKINKNPEVKQQILPKTAILSDEMMATFWVMKLINDSTAIRIDIEPGVSNKEMIEIKAPSFNAHDRFLVSGNYGLPDTALVRVIH